MLALMFKKRAERLEGMSTEVKKMRAETGQGEGEPVSTEARRVNPSEFFSRIDYFRKKGSGVAVRLAASKPQ